MLVTAEELGSRLIYADPPVATFEMRKFRGRELRTIWETKRETTTDEIKAFAMAIRDCIDPASCDLEALMNGLTIFDLWQLVVRQWQESNTPILLRGVCQHPVYHFVNSAGSQESAYTAADVPEGATILTVDACGGSASAYLTKDDVKILHVHGDCKATAPLEDVQLPLLRHLYIDDYLADDRTHLLMMALNEHDVDELEAESFMAISRWMSRNVHGVVNDALVVCPECGRKSTTKWQMNIGVFFE